MLLYLVGHGFAKGVLFMRASVLLSRCRTIDEVRFHGPARHLPVTGVAFALGGLLLAGMPVGMLHKGRKLSAVGLGEPHTWVARALRLGSILTGAAVLRATAQVFLGLGPNSDPCAVAPGRPESERGGRPIWL